MRITLLIALLSITMFSNCQNTSNTMIDKTTVKNVEIDKYLGSWYEIARFPHSFEKDLVGVTATYTMRDDGKIKVLNQGYKYTLDGKHSTAVGKAKIPDLNNTGKLKVSFFLFFYAEYNILVLDQENYQYAIVGSSSEDYLWILSRTPVMEEKTYSMLLKEAQKRGYKIDNLIKVLQK